MRVLLTGSRLPRSRPALVLLERSREVIVPETSRTSRIPTAIQPYCL